jgi:hypothetical protein
MSLVVLNWNESALNFVGFLIIIKVIIVAPSSTMGELYIGVTNLKFWKEGVLAYKHISHPLGIKTLPPL